ncbi:flagellin [Aequoribacter sp.]|uniref:flagellin N-terminal helical domain-containing protein n=1 Tax=Aequoribacter sp. TaxID=2847771 RepID=UPI003C37E5BF
MAVINTNMSALVAQNALVKNERSMSAAMEQLSTGSRINSAADDAAGIGISSVMTSQIRGLNQAVRNANDAISMIQTAEGAFSEVENMLQRMRELAIQASNDSYSAAQRSYANTEFTQLAEQIKAIGDNTQFNGQQLLDGNTKEFQIGNSATAATTFSFTEIDQAGGSTETFNVTTSGGAAGAQDVLTLTVSGAAASGANAHSLDLVINGTSFTIGFTSDGAGNTSALTVNGVGTASGTFTPADSSLSGALTFAIAANEITVTAANNGVNTISAGATTVTASYGASGGIYDAISAVGLTSQANSQAALSVLDTQIAAVAADRASMGATINRLEYTADNLLSESANTSAARSRVVDADYATATTELARTQIIQQAGTAMLAQANQLPQTVLSLLQ